MTLVLVPYPGGREYLADVAGVEILTFDAAAPLPEAALEAEVLVAPFLSKGASDLVDRLPKLRLVQLLTAGAEAWIGKLPDGVGLSDCRGAHGGSTAEWAVAVLLAVYRDLPGFVRAQARGEWSYHTTDELAGKRVLILGAGDIAGNIARRLEPFDVATTLVGRTARDGVHGIGEMPELLPRHDACIVIVPLTAQTRGLVDAEFLAAMPDGAVLVNAARGPIVDTDALLAELTAGRLRAALDVTDPEPLPAGHPLWEAPNLLLTPHIGGAVPAALRRAFRVAAEQIAAFARGEEPPNLVRGDY